jgi:hypothetical protein
MRTREVRQVQAELVGANKPIVRGGPDDLPEVRLADSTWRSGEPATGGSGRMVRGTHGLHTTGGYGPLCNERRTPAMTTGLEAIAAKARCEPKLRFTSLAHHITRQLIWEGLCHIPNDSAPGCDGQRVVEAKEEFEVWVEPGSP